MAKKSMTLTAVEPPKQEAPAPVGDPIQNMLQKISGMHNRVGSLRAETETLANEIEALQTTHAAEAGAAIVSGALPPPEPVGLARKKETLESKRRILAAAEKQLTVEVDFLRRLAQSELGRRHRNFEAASSAYSEFLQSRLTKLLLLFGEIIGDINALELLSDKPLLARKITADVRGIREAENRGLQSGMSAQVSIATQSLVALASAPVGEVFDRVLSLSEMMQPWNEIQRAAEEKLARVK
jgi:hypothetical protein